MLDPLRGYWAKRLSESQLEDPEPSDPGPSKIGGRPYVISKIVFYLSTAALVYVVIKLM